MKWSFRLTLAGCFVAALTLALGAQSDFSPKSAQGPTTEIGCATFAAAQSGGGESHGFDLANLDRSVSPCDNFYQFADGGWIKSHEIPAAYPSWGSFNALLDHNQEQLRTILEEEAKNTNAQEGTIGQKVGAYYASCMNEDAIEAAGTKPLDAEFARIAKISSVKDLEAEIAHLHSVGVDAMFRFGSTQDFKDSKSEIGGAFQGGIGLPDRDYYLKDDDKSKTLRDAYQKHVHNMFQLLGDDDATATAEAKTVMDIETNFSKASMDRVARRKPENVYHKMDLAQLGALTPDFSWSAYFEGIGYPEIHSVNVGMPDFFKNLNADLNSISLADWKTYLRWQLVHAAAPALPAKFVNENFDFYGRALTGTKELLPRWKRCVQSTDRRLGEALGQLYVKRYFPPASKAAALKMVHNLIEALREDLATLDWMSPETRAKATKKLDAIQLKIGYPDKWRDYSAFHVTRGAYIENVQRGEKFDFDYEVRKIGKPVDRTEWGMTPPTVNAYYSAPMNEIVFPAGILQPPFYDPNVDEALNYGGIGAVIGHEMTHGFDDQGSKFDAAGNLENWWTPDDLKNFQARSECVAKQFDGYVVEPGLNENGHLVLGESIADLGGLTISYAAFQKTAQAREAKPIDGFTPNQRFFLGWALVWANNSRPEFERLMASTNPHPLGKYRAIGPPSNMPVFAEAFGCKAGSGMVRSDEIRCRIW
ncbi:MAG: M13 family metallopeptidase [Candidatus Acidiferrales bacterium]